MVYKRTTPPVIHQVLLKNQVHIYISEPAVQRSPMKTKRAKLKMTHTSKAASHILDCTIYIIALILMIIDEIELVSRSLFQKFNQRLSEIFKLLDKSDVYFGNIPVLLFEGLAQFEPVAAKQMFCRPLNNAL
ncbi:unnamed protein product [Rotaria socialis]|uniref:Uncharacterized protein n=1 Tax=Rotaria socialis TaxID=392032 RepID=A0A821VK19_9BILA|nr:unnamed protein product [Rotaria socialis]